MVCLIAAITAKFGSVVLKIFRNTCCEKCCANKENSISEDSVGVMTPRAQVEKRMGKADIWLDKHKWQQHSRDQVTSFFSTKVWL